jgi:hypothetical protein
LNNINNNLFVFKKLIFVLPENNNIKQSTNSRPRNILFLSTKDKINNIISFLINKIDNILGIIGAGEKTKEINFYNTINNIISKIDIFFF